jgi:hypothetical protein
MSGIGVRFPCQAVRPEAPGTGARRYLFAAFEVSRL